MVQRYLTYWQRKQLDHATFVASSLRAHHRFVCQILTAYADFLKLLAQLDETWHNISCRNGHSMLLQAPMLGKGWRNTSFCSRISWCFSRFWLQFLFYSVFRSTATTLKKKKEPKVTSVTIPTKWKMITICLRKTAQFDQKIHATHRETETTQNFWLRNNEFQ